MQESGYKSDIESMLLNTQNLLMKMMMLRKMTFRPVALRKKLSKTKSKTPVLDNFGRDLTKLAEDDKLDPIVGREKEIERVSQILLKKKNNPLLIEKPGVGKSAIAEGLALRITQRKVSRVLFNKRIVSLGFSFFSCWHKIQRAV